MPLTHCFIKTIRSVHLYLGVFTVPALLFFAITGGLQSFGLHESSRGSSYTPPAWLVSAAQLHKKQTLMRPQRRAPPAAPPAARPAEAAKYGASDARKERSQEFLPRKNLWPMKIFFGLVSLSLLISTLTGLYMAFRFSRRPVVISALLVAGIAVPLLLLLF